MEPFDSATVESKIIETRRGGEALVFEIPLGLLKIVCIANIPEEEESKSSVYVRFVKGDIFKGKGRPAVRRTQPVAPPRRVEVLKMRERTG
jgi:hypothetical protein